jgi:hypothetical protein
MTYEIDFELAGLGIIIFSPKAVSHISQGENYLEQHFWEPADVARHVMDCQLTTFCTGSPGRYRISVIGGPPDPIQEANAVFRLRLGLEVHDETICIRDLYDLLDWDPISPQSREFKVANGWYRLTVISSPPPSGIIGDNQTITIYMELVNEKPILRWEGVPNLC